MRRIVMLMLLLTGGAALAQEAEPAQSSLGSPEVRVPRQHPLRPIPFFYREFDLQRQNVGLNGRKNATRDEQRTAETPSLRPGPFSDFAGW